MVYLTTYALYILSIQILTMAWRNTVKLAILSALTRGVTAQQQIAYAPMPAPVYGPMPSPGVDLGVWALIIGAIGVGVLAIIGLFTVIGKLFGGRRR